MLDYIVLCGGTLLADQGGYVYPHSGPRPEVRGFGVTIAGGTHVFIPKFDPVDMLKTIAKYQVTQGMMVPVMIQAMPPFLWTSSVE